MSEPATTEVDFDRATVTAGRALQLMAQHAVPATPQNFEIWYKFALGTSPGHENNGPDEGHEDERHVRRAQ